jgi:hypothetical protein
MNGARLRLGDTFTIPGFNAVNPATREAMTGSRRFIVTGVCMSTGRVDLAPFLPAFTTELSARIIG